jgi:putative phage-type endonuclease
MIDERLLGLCEPERIVMRTTEENREQFEALHEKEPALVSSSKIPTIVGLNPFKSAFELWCEDTGRAKKPESDSDLLWMGHQMEPIIGRLAERRGLGRALPVCAVIRAHEPEWAIASPDFLLMREGEEPELLEAKNTGWWAKDQWGEDKAPDYAHVQVQWQLYVIGTVQAARIAGLIGGDPRNFVTCRFEVDSRIQETLLAAALKYRACIESDTPPEVGPEDKAAVCEAFPPTEGHIIELDDEAGALIKEHDEVAEILKAKNADAKKLEDLKKALQAKLALKLGDAEAGVFEGRQVVKKKVERKGYEVKPCEFWQVTVKNYKA